MFIFNAIPKGQELNWNEISPKNKIIDKKL